MDMTEGIIARFRTMAIARAAVLTGHVVGAVIADDDRRWPWWSASALLVGFRPDRRPGASGSPRSALLALIAFALTWLSVALGMVAQERRERPATCRCR